MTLGKCNPHLTKSPCPFFNAVRRGYEEVQSQIIEHMTQALPKLVTFDEFITWYPENSECRYELHNGVIVEMPPPTGDREEVIGFLAAQLTLEFTRLQLSYFIPKTAFVRMPENKSAYEPDIVIINR